MHCVGQVLLVCKHEEQSVLHFTVGNNAVQFLSGLVDSGLVSRVNNEDETLGAGKVVAPEGADLFLSTHVPDVESNVFVCEGFHVESDCGDCRDSFDES